LADRLGDHATANKDRAVAKELESVITSHWLPAGKQTPFGGISTGQIWDSFDRVKGPDYKSTGLDVAAILGALHAHNDLDARDDRFFSPSDDRILKTAWLLSRAFIDEYMLVTHGIWRRLLSPKTIQAGDKILKSDERFSQMMSSIRALGDSYLRIVEIYETPKGNLNEEFSRLDGSPQGAENLSWSYASLLTAAKQRSRN
jgi:hypothetical protein